MLVAALFLTNFARSCPDRCAQRGHRSGTAIRRTGAILGPLVLGVFLTFGTAVSQIIYFFSIPLLLATLVSIVLLRVDSRQKTLTMIHEAASLDRAAARPTPAKATT